jgi:hypothetical protein
MAYKNLYDEATQIPKPTGSQYISPIPADQLGLPNMQRSLRQYGSNIDTSQPWQNVVGTTAEGAQINIHPSILPRTPNPTPNRIPLQTQENVTQSQTQKTTTPNVTPFLWNMMSTMRDMDTESRTEYLGTVSSGIKDKLDSFAMRLARGIPLTPEQNKRYMSLRDAFNDIQRYSTNQSAYDEYLSAFNQSGTASAPGEKEAWRTGSYRS